MIRSLTEGDARRRLRRYSARHVAAGHVQGQGDDGRSRDEGQVGKGILAAPSPFVEVYRPLDATGFVPDEQ